MQQKADKLNRGFTATTITALIILIASANVASANMKTMGAHNFVTEESDKYSQKSCLVCHEANEDGSPAQFKIKDVSGKHTTMYTMYTTINGNQGTLSNSTKLCLSCHDGSAASDASDMSSAFSNSMSIGSDLRNDHPVGVAYPPKKKSARSARTYYSTPLGNVRVYGSGIKTVECISCHDPHGGPIKKMLREPMTRSGLCLKCHNL